MTGEGSAAARALVQTTLLGELLENAQIGALAIESGRYVAANRYACELTGYERTEPIGRRVGELDPFSGPSRPFREVHTGRREASTITLRRKDGRELGVLCFAVETMLSGLPLVLTLFSPG
jgi:PAS domain S-box-containing protein